MQVDAAGVGAGGFAADVMTFDQGDRDAFACEIVGHGTAHDTAADHEDVGVVRSAIDRVGQRRHTTGNRSHSMASPGDRPGSRSSFATMRFLA